jgi:streptogramin lyase
VLPRIASVIAGLLSFLLFLSTPACAAQVGEITEFSEGLQGSPPGAQSLPRSIAAGPDGNLWFTDEGTSGGENMIGRVTPNGTITEWPLPSTSRPDSITAGPDGNVWFTDIDGAIGRIHPVGTYSEIGASIVEFHAPDFFANSITSGPDGNVWFTQLFPVRAIGRITPDGAMTTWPLAEDSKPISITTGPDGRLWYTDDSRATIGRIDPDGTDAEIGASLVEFDPGKVPLFITAGPGGKLWFTHNGEGGIGSMTTAGVVNEFETPVESLDSIAAGPDGNVWFTDFGTTDHAINRMTPSGVITRYSQGLQGEGVQSYPGSITAGPDGNLWFTDWGFAGGEHMIGRIVAGPAVAQPTLTVAKSGTGAGTVMSKPAGIRCGATCPAAEGTFYEDAGVILTATPNTSAGSTFAGWSGCDAVNGEGKCEVTMSEAKSVTAEFGGTRKAIVDPQLLTVSKAGGSGSGKVTSKPAGISCEAGCAQVTSEFKKGTLVILTGAAPAGSGSTFAGWSGCDAVNGEGKCEVTMSGARSVTAQFSE